MKFVPKFGSLGRRAIRASGWNAVQLLAMTLARLGSNLIMTRLLLPEAFGVMALVSSLLSAYILLSDIGIVRSIIRDPEGEEPHFLQAAWTVQLLRAVLVAGAILASAGALWLVLPHVAPAGTIYADPRLPGLIALSALGPLMTGAMSANRPLAMRRLQNWRFAMVAVTSQLVGIAAQVGFASVWPTVWALMFGMLMINLSGLIFSHTVFPGPRMKIVWDRAIADRLWQFGKFIMGSSALTFVGQNADKFILAGLLDATAFGLYSIALIWVAAGRQLIGQLSSRVGFPAMSEVFRDRPKEVPRLFNKMQAAIDIFCVLAFLACVLLGPWFIGLLYTDTYQTAGHYLQLLGLAYLVARYNTINELIMNTGNSRALMWVAAANAVSICIFLPLGYSTLGVEGAILAVALSPLISAPYSIRLLRPVLGARWLRREIACFAAILAAAAGTYLLY
jgi:O-antigen/teichoic acid export membrane protein